MPSTAFLKAEGTNIVPTGRRTYSRYFKVEFAFTRVKYVAQPRPIDPAKVEFQAQVIDLRAFGWSFPVIAKQLHMSVGTTWNIRIAIMNAKMEQAIAI